MKMKIIILSLAVLSVLSAMAQSTLTATLVNRKYGFGYPSLTKKDKMGYPLIEALVIPAKYDETTNITFSEEYESLVGVKLDGKWGYIDATGATKIPFKFDEAGYFHEGLAPVILNGKCGFINKSGTIVIPYKYDYATSFTDGISYVELGGKIGFINKTGTAVVPIKYDKQTDEAYKRCYHCGGAMNSFKDGKAVVVLNGKCGTIDTKGTFTECKDEELETITFTGVATKDHPSAWIKGSCKTNQDIRTITVNDKPRNDISINYDNQTMFCYLSGIKAGDPISIKLIHAKGCTYTLTQPDGITLGAGQANVVEHEAKRAPEGLDSTTFSGTITGAMLIVQSSAGAHDIKKITLNGTDISRQLMSSQRQLINFAKFNLKKGQKLTVKIWHVQGTTVKMMDPKGIE